MPSDGGGAPDRADAPPTALTEPRDETMVETDDRIAKLEEQRRRLDELRGYL